MLGLIKNPWDGTRTLRGDQHLQELATFLHARQFNIQPTFDGKLLRFDRTKPNTGWFVGHKWSIADKEFFYCKMGDWATDEEFEWKSNFDGSPEEKKEFDLHFKATNELLAKQKIERHEYVAKQSEDLWARGIDRGITPYLERKGLRKLYGARIDADRPGNLLVPLRDANGRLWNLQKIFPEKIPPNNLDKVFTKGGRVKGLFHTIGEIHNEGRIFICEGFATGASIHESTSHCAIVCFYADNLKTVTHELRIRYPKAHLSICGDDDQFTTKGNAGREKTALAARGLGIQKIFPKFKNLTTSPTDFNDLMLLEGKEAVKDQIINAPIIKELEPIVELNKDGQPKKISESKLVNALLNFYDGEFIKQNDDLFKWVGTHWKYQEEKEINSIKTNLIYLSGDTLTHRQIESAFKHFVTKTKVANKNMFQPNPFFANFLNGTLQISKIPGENRYGLTFRDHSPSDFITNVIPLNYEPEKLEANFEFLKSVDRIFEDDPDKSEKIQSLKELFGSCLTPLFPRIFLLVGPPGSGKSTFSILASKLVSENNLSMVEPHEFRGFHMESMLGKLVNISTDIRTNEAIDDAMMKKIEDRIPVRIDRKFAKAVMAWLPAIHIFGCNKLPPNYEGDSRAFTRRTTILNFRSFKASGHFNRNFANEIFVLSPGGVLNFALEGLLHLLNNGGHFTQPASGATTLEDWQLNYDPIGQFFKDLFNNEIEGQSKLMPGQEFQIERKKMWESFKIWHTDSFGKLPRLSKTKFYEQVEERFCPLVKVDGLYYFKSVKIIESGSSEM